MLKNLLIIIILLFSFFVIYAEDQNTLYRAVIKVSVAGVHEGPDVTTPLHTQALLNEEVVVLREYRNFVYARVPDGYYGYIRISDITRDTSNINAEGDKVIIISKFANIFDYYGNIIYRAPMTSIFIGNPNRDKYLIYLPQNNIGYIDINDIMIIYGNEIPLGSRANFAQIARQFLGTRYLWGGCSADGIDCSGLTYIAAKMNGLRIPRDSFPQSQLGFNIDLRNAVAGDQLFFSSDTRKTRVTHTGIYLGNGNFIHSTDGQGVVIHNIYSNSFYMNRLMYVKRLPFL